MKVVISLLLQKLAATEHTFSLVNAPESENTLWFGNRVRHKAGECSRNLIIFILSLRVSIL